MLQELGLVPPSGEPMMQIVDPLTNQNEPLQAHFFKEASMGFARPTSWGTHDAGGKPLNK